MLFLIHSLRGRVNRIGVGSFVPEPETHPHHEKSTSSRLVLKYKTFSVSLSAKDVISPSHSLSLRVSAPACPVPHLCSEGQRRLPTPPPAPPLDFLSLVPCPRPLRAGLPTELTPPRHLRARLVRVRRAPRGRMLGRARAVRGGQRTLGSATFQRSRKRH
jgi:hypothetical protein